MNKTSNEGILASVVAYLTIIGSVIAFFINNDSKNPIASFHIRQALGTHITYYMLGLVISWFDSWLISSAFFIFVLILWGYGFIGALQGKALEVPILGKYYQNWFKNIT